MTSHEQSPDTSTFSHRLVPDFILEQYAAGEPSGRFSAVVLFVDTSGFTPLTAQLQAHATAGAEVLANVLLAVFEPLIGAVYANGGFVAGFAGDAFKAIFPTTDARAFVAALTTAGDIRLRMAAQAVQQTPFGDFPFAVRTSIASGRVEWVIWRADDANDANEEGSQQAIYTFGGEALDAAVYGESLAQAGELIVTEAVRAALAQIEQFAAEPLAETAAYSRVTHMGVLSVPPVITTVPSEVASDTLAPFYPHDLVVQTSQGEFRRVLTLFINLQTLPTAEEEARFTTTFFNLLERYGGYACRLGRIGALDAGGTLLLFWGAPTSHENDVERVLNFVLDLQARTDIPLRAGITYQIAYAGFVGSPLREEYTCYGLSVNLAARLMTTAPWGGIWVDEAIAKRGKKLFRLEQIGERLFKGFSEPRPVYQLRRRRAMMSTMFFKDQMVGRQRELLQLAAMLAPVQNGRFGGVVTISGEAGIGKSHLIHECLNKIDFISRGELFLCQCDEILRESFNPFRYFLRHHFEQRATQTEEQNKTRFESILEALIVDMKDEPALRTELERTRSFLGALIGLQWESSLYAQSPPKLRQENTFIALKTLIKAESLRKPVVIQIEDAHWLDDDSRQFLLELTRNVSAFPFMILITTRDAEAGELTVGDGVSQRQIHLQALGGKSVTNLAQTLLNAPVSAELSELIVERTDGNPFFVEQFVIFLREQEMLQPAEGGLRPVAAVSTLPTDLQAILVARIDQLTQQVRHVVQTAAILGREFDVQILSHMLQNEAALPEKIKAAESVAIWSALSELYYLFKHALLRDAAYNMQLQAQRRELHRVAAEAIMTVYEADLSLYYADLAYHYRQAEDVENERHYAFLAGEQAAERFAHAQALGYLTRVLLLTADPAERFSALQVRLGVYATTGQRDKQQGDIEELSRLAEKIVDEKQASRQAQVALAEALLAEGTADYAAAEQAAAEAVRLARLAQDSEIETNGLLRLIIALWFQSRYDEARAQAAVMLELAQAEALPISEGHALLQFGNISFLEGQYADAQQWYAQALVIYREQNHVIGIAPALANLGLVSKQMAPDQARAYFEQALAINRQMGARRGTAHSLSSLAGLELDLGNYEAVLQQTASILPLLREVDDRTGEIYRLTLLVNTYRRLGDYAQAEKHVLEEIQLCEALNNLHSKCLALTQHGLILYLQEDFEQAMAKQQAALVVAEEIDLDRVKIAPLIYLGHALSDVGRLDEAEKRYGEAGALLDEISEPVRQIYLLAGLARLALRQGDVVKAAAQVEQIRTLLAGQRTEAVEEPVKVYLICYEVLEAQGDAAAAEMLEAGYQFLHEQAARLQDEARRQRFLTGIAAHRAVVARRNGLLKS